MKQRILLISHASNVPTQLDTLQTFVKDLNSSNTDMLFSFCMIQDVLFVIKAGQISISVAGRELHSDYDTVHLRNPSLYADFANAIRLYTAHTQITLVNAADVTLPYYGKLSQGFLFALNGIPTPDLMSSVANQTLLSALQSTPYEYPYILKHNAGIKGLDNYLIHQPAEAEAVLSGLKAHFVAQPFIANDGELRVLSFGQSIDPIIFRKQAAEGTHLNNTSQGGQAEQLKATAVAPAVLQVALDAAKLTGREIGGVDVLLAKSGQPYILEVNATPAVASGVFLEQKQQHYAEYFKPETEKV